jgi:tetratricopeptide (TPR) repeat protein
MAKPGRNEPCHCQSGKKYKKCCLDKDAAAASARLAKDNEQNRQFYDHALSSLADWDDDDAFLQATNTIPDLVRAGKLDEAEAAAHKLLLDFPDQIDSFERLGMVYEKRGNHKTAADYYRKALAYIDQFPEGFEDASRDYYKNKITKLDPQAA